MGMDNLDVFEKIVFHIPSTKLNLAAIILLSPVYSAMVYLGFSAFTSLSLYPEMIAYMAFLLFALPPIISGEVFHYFLPEYPRHWGYFLALSNQFFIFIFAMILTGADNGLNAWRVVWLAVITVFLITTLVLTLTLGSKYVRRIIPVSLIHPGLVLLVSNYYLSPFIQSRWLDYALNFGVMAFAGITLGAVLYTVEYLIGTNVSNISAFQLTAGLLQKEQRALDLGYNSNVEVQTLQIENRNDEASIGVPWVHPGPLGAFGGGELSTTIIESLNGSGSQGFFMHVPSNHEADMADPQDAEKIIKCVKEPDTSSQASELIEKSYDIGRIYGRRFNGNKLIFMDVPAFDDYEISVVKEAIDLSDTTVIDLHNHVDEETSQVVWYGTRKAEELRDAIHDLESELESAELKDYRAGFNSDLEGIAKFTWVEEVGGQKTLIYGIEGNGSTKALEEIRSQLQEDYDKVLFFTTDTHASIHEMAKGSHVNKERLKNSIETSESRLGEAEIGLRTEIARDVKLLQPDYQGLIYSINILVRLLPLALVSMYVLLVLWLI